MTKINTNVASLRGLRSLNKSNQLLGTTLTRLSTGLQINSGKDSPAGLIAGETLRAQITTIEQSIKNSNRANNVLSTADSAMGEVSGLLNQIRGLVQEGLNDGALSDAEIAANQLQIDAALSAINRISANTTFAGDKLIDGSKGFTTELTAADAAELNDYQINEAVFGSNSTVEVVATIDTAAEKAELQFTGTGLTEETTLEISGSKGSQVLFFGASSTTQNVADAINAASGVTGVSASVAGQVSSTTQIDAVAGTLDVATTVAATAGTVTQDATAANADITFTDARTTASQGVFSDAVDIEYVKAGNSTALSVSVATDGNGDHTITVNLATDANGDVTSTAAQIENAINNDANANALVTAAADGDGSGTVNNASVSAFTLADGVDEITSGLEFTDARTTTTQGVFSESVDVELLNAGANQTLSVTVTTDGNGDHTISVNLATDANGVVTSTANDVEALLNNDANANALVTTSDDGNGGTVLNAASASTLADGTDAINAGLTYTDARSDTSTGLTVELADPSANNATLGAVVTTDGNGDTTIVVNLATDANGNITSTDDDIAALLNNNATTNALITTTDNTGTATTAAAAAAVDVAGSANGILTLSSSNYGSNEFVDVNVLSGSFATTLNDGSTVASRDTGVDIGVTINGQTAQGSGLQASVKTANLDASMNFAAASNAIGTSSTITITGGGSLFQIGQEVSSQGQIGIGIEAVNTARLGGISGKLYELGSGAGKSLLDVGPSTPGSTLVDIVDEAISKVNTLRGRIGAIQKNVIETNISTLSVALENISEARSSIMDADFAIETANMTRAQILSQAGTSVLSIANQTPAQVLSLLG